MKIVSKLTFLGIILFFSINAYAGQLDSSGLLDSLLDKFQQVASTWTTVIADYANWLFWGLVLISMVWTFGMMAMQGEGLTGVLAEIVRFFAVIGFFYYLLINGPSISQSIINSMRQLAANALGISTGISPSSIVDMAFAILTKVSSAASIWSPMISTIYDNSRDNRFGSDVPYSGKYANHVGFCMGVMLCRSYIAWIWWFEMDL